jgi:hypothetical protein
MPRLRFVGGLFQFATEAPLGTGLQQAGLNRLVVGNAAIANRNLKLLLEQRL